MTAEPERVERPTRTSPARAPEAVFVGPRARLVRAGQELLFERHDTSYTVEELVRRAGVAIKTFYRSFPNKEEFLHAVFVDTVAGAVPALRESVLASSQDPLERLRNTVVVALSARGGYGTSHRVIANEHLRIASTSPETIAAASRPYQAFIRELLVDAADAGQVRPADLDWDVYIVTSMITSSFHALVLGLGEPDRAELAENVWRFCLTALGGPAAED